MGTIECSQPASKSSWDSQDFGDISMVLKMAYFRKSTGPRWVNIAVHTDAKIPRAFLKLVKMFLKSRLRNPEGRVKGLEGL